jgi:hypothetical protein
MKLATWRNAALVLGVLCLYQRWQGCSHSNAPGEPSASAADTRRAAATPATRTPASATAAPALPASPDASAPGGAAAAAGKNFHGFHIPAWALHLAPQRGETLRAYRDRILPLAELAIAPQRARVARTRDNFAALDPHQRAELDAAVADAARAIQDRITAAFAAGELRPAAFKPMTGVAIARDVLDIVDRGNTRFVQTLTPDQRTQLASHHFDFADYLLFSAPWEDALHALD